MLAHIYTGKYMKHVTLILPVNWQFLDKMLTMYVCKVCLVT